MKAVEAIPRVIQAETEAEWQAAWHYVPKVPKFIRQLGKNHRGSHREALDKAAYFAAGKLYDEDFHLFSNGGQPLLKRQRGEWFDEILFHAPPNCIPGEYSPVTVEVIVSFEPLREIRSKISRSCSMVPPFLAKANLGQLQVNPARTIWNLDAESSIAEIGTLLSGPCLRWMDELCDPISLEDRAIEGSLPFVDDATALELVLASGGRNAAKRVIAEWRADPFRGPKLEAEVARLSRRFGPVYRSDEVGTNIAVLCICFDLWDADGSPYLLG